MNILVITEKAGERSGWERYSSDMIRALVKRGHTLSVICAEKNTEKSDLALPAIQYECLPGALSFKRTYIFSGRYTRKAVDFIRQKNIAVDAVHCFVEPYSRIAEQIAGKLGVPYFITAHGSYAVRPFAPGFFLFGFGFFQKKAYERAKAVICVSQYTKQRILSYVSRINAVVINNGVNVGAGANAAEANGGAMAKVSPILLSVGALKERKGYEYVLRALPDIVKKIPDLKYIVVGSQKDEPYVAKLRTIIVENHLEKYVELKERISDDELDGLYCKAKVFILTPVSSAFSFEGFGLVYLEANMRGVPAIGSRGNGGEDAIQDGRTGLLTAPKDPADIAEKAIRLLTLSDAEYAGFAERSRAWAESKSWNLLITEYTDLYEHSRPVR